LPPSRSAGPCSLVAGAPISTPGLNDAALFRGIEYAGGIRRLELSGSKLAVMDFVVRAGGGPVPVPEPSSLALLLLAVPMMLRRRRRKARALDE